MANARDLWLSRLRGGNRGESTQRAYRNAVDDLLAWAADRGRDEILLTEAAMVEHLDHYQRTRSPMPATYHRRFILLRRFVRWVCQRHGLPDPFVDLDAPEKPRQTADWLTPDEFAAVLEAAADPLRKLDGLAERDRLVLLALVTTGLRRAELIGLDWQHLVLDGPQPSALVRGKGDRPRRQPLAPALVDELRVVRDLRRPEPTDPVFCGLQGGRLSPKILASIVSRNAIRAGLQKRVTAHTLRHTAATWLRQQTRRCAPGRGVPRARRPLDRRPLCARRALRAARGRGCALAHGHSLFLTSPTDAPVTETPGGPPGRPLYICAAARNVAGRSAGRPCRAVPIETARAPAACRRLEFPAKAAIEKPRRSGAFP